MSVATLGAQFPANAGDMGASIQGRSNFGQQKPLFNQARAGSSSTGLQRASLLPARAAHAQQALTASIPHLEDRALGPYARGYHRSTRPPLQPVGPWAPAPLGRLPPALYRLLDPTASVELPPAHKIGHHTLDNRELDKLVAALGRSKATWRRAIVLHEWLQEIGHRPDDRLCTTLVRLCSSHGAAAQALGLYDWMRASSTAGGAGLKPTVFTYTAAMRAALNGNLPERAMQVWEDAKAARCTADCRMSTVYIEVCTRAGNPQAALSLYKDMAAAPAGSRMAPSVHTYTAAMRAAAADSKTWHEALTIWDDMLAANCTPTGHAYAAAISACATGGEWRRAVSLFDGMLENSIQPDVVSCTALISALAADGQWQHAERALEWMLQAGVKPNVRTYTALITAMANAHEWQRAVDTLKRMKTEVSWRRVEPNAYTYSALLKLLGEQGRWQLAEEIFTELENEALQDIGVTGMSLSDDDFSDEVPHIAVLAPFGSANPGDIWGAQRPTGWDSDSISTGPAGPSSHGITIRPPSSTSTPHAGETSDSGSDIMSSGSFGEMPKLLAEQVLDDRDDGMQRSRYAGSSSDSTAASVSNQDELAHSSGFGLPDSIPGQSNVETLPRTPRSFASFSSSVPQDSPSSSRGHRREGSTGQQMQQSSPASHLRMSSSPFQLPAEGEWQHAPEAAPADVDPDTRPQAVLNVVVCGALMSAFEMSAKWDKAVDVLGRARRLRIRPNTVMYNIAMSALGKSGNYEAVEAMFEQVADPDSISYETVIAAMGMAGQTDRAEAWLEALRDAGHHPRDYVFTALVCAHSMAGDLPAALRVRKRMKLSKPPVAPSVYVYNALIAACQKENCLETAMDLHAQMRREGVGPNADTLQLMSSVGRAGCSVVERHQAVAAALSAAVAAAGGVMMRVGAF